jgi:putative tryptophan/tyrosine transport system substrate-binding protein
MKRREFITLVGGAAVARPLTARAQQAGKVPTIGFLAASGFATGASPENQWAAAFAQRLEKLGWVDGRTIRIEYRWAEGRTERFADIAAELVRRQVDVIVAPGGAAVAVKRATSVIPIVFAIAGDPVGSGLVESLARPSGNATGQSLQATDLAGKRMELLREIVPGLHRLAIIGNLGYSAVGLEVNQAQAAAATLGLEMTTLDVRRNEDIAPAIESIKGKVQALYVVPESLIVAAASQIGALTLAARLPSIHGLREFVEAKGVMSYGPNFTDLWRHAADIVDKILRGAKPADIPVEQPTKFDLIFNLTTAKALGLTIPPSLLSLADELIE